MWTTVSTRRPIMISKMKKDDVLKYDPFSPYYDNEGNPLEKPLYLPKYHKSRFHLPKKTVEAILDAIDKGEYHTVAQVKDMYSESSTHAFLVLQIMPTDNQDEYLIVSEDYGMVQ
jgi:hypothetical protein